MLYDDTVISLSSWVIWFMLLNGWKLSHIWIRWEDYNTMWRKMVLYLSPNMNLSWAFYNLSINFRNWCKDEILINMFFFFFLILCFWIWISFISFYFLNKANGKEKKVGLLVLKNVKLQNWNDFIVKLLVLVLGWQSFSF